MIDVTFYKNRGDIEPQCILVENDVCGIVKRIQEIDKDYFVVFNPGTQRFELHHAGQVDSTYCLTFPFEELDSRAVVKTLETSSARAKIILAEMIAHNEKLEKSKNDKMQDEASWKTKELYHYALRHGIDGCIDNTAYSTRWA
jgi:hypothetical protein